LQKFKELAYCPSKCSLLKNRDPGSLCKKWGVRVSHVEKPPVFGKKKMRQPGLLHFLWKFQGGYVLLLFAFLPMMIPPLPRA
jgi:hypothetical protein